MIERRRASFNREKQIIVNLILDSQFCREVLPYIKDDYFKSKYAKSIITWVRDYYEQYEQAPREQIEDIYENEREYIDFEIAEQIGTMLQHLSDVADTENHNTDYLVNKAIEFFDERHTKLQIEAAEHYASKGELARAKEALNTPFELKSSNFEWVNFADEDFVRMCVRQMVQQQDLDSAFFSFDGRLGEFIGAIDRGWFVSFLAPAKRGKTTYMMESIVTAIRRKLNVVVLSLEMPIPQLYKRYLLCTVGERPGLDEREVPTPVMDCEHNQDGTCELPQRSNNGSYGSLMHGEGARLSYTESPDWVPCTECRSKPEFKTTSWQIPITKVSLTESEFVKRTESFNKLFGKYCRAIHVPSKTATVSDLKTEIRLLEQRENFIPDVVVIDYADLIRPDVMSGTKRFDLDDIWEQLRAWGQTDRVLIISASQTNRMSAEAEYMKDTHVAEDYSKIAKLDVAIGLCQNDLMKERGMLNLNKVAHRHEDYVQSHFCTVLQELGHQQAVLDSEFRVT